METTVFTYAQINWTEGL